jgi:hypothetical protein
MRFSINNTPPDFYVYVYLRKNGTVYYVGKGKGNRAWAHYKERCNTPRDPSRVLIVWWGLTEIGAFAGERYLIRWYRRKNVAYTDLDGGCIPGQLINLTDGGEGCSGIVDTPETRAKKSASGRARKGKFKYSQERLDHLESMCRNRLGKPGTPLTLSTEQRSYLAERYRKMNAGVPKNRVSCIHCRSEITVNTLSNHNRQCRLNPNRAPVEREGRAVRVNGVEYTTVKKASLALGISVNTIIHSAQGKRRSRKCVAEYV